MKPNGDQAYNSTSSWEPVIQKRNRLDVLPIANDLLKLRNYLVEAIDHRIKAVKTEPNKQNFRELAEVCIARLYVQQKKR